MLLSYFLQILCPIAIEPKFFLSQRIKSFHDRADTLLKPLLELHVTLVPRLHDCLVVIRVSYLTIIANFILGLLLHQQLLLLSLLVICRRRLLLLLSFLSFQIFEMFEH